MLAGQDQGRCCQAVKGSCWCEGDEISALLLSVWITSGPDRDKTLAFNSSSQTGYLIFLKLNLPVFICQIISTSVGVWWPWQAYVHFSAAILWLEIGSGSWNSVSLAHFCRRQKETTLWTYYIGEIESQIITNSRASGFMVHRLSLSFKQIFDLSNMNV